MEPYSRAILLFVHALLESGRGVEAFAFGTRLTRLTEELSGPDPERALAEASKRVVDWSGGTRIGASLKAFNDLWGRRALSRGAVVDDRLRRLGARGRGDRRPRDGAARALRLRGRVGQPAQGPPRVRAARGRDARGAAASSTGSCPGTICRVSKTSPASSPASRGGMRHEGDPGRRRALAGEGREGRDRDRGRDAAVGAAAGRREASPSPRAGEIAGSVSGGCVESDVYENAREVLETGEPKLLSLRDRGRGGLVGRPARAAARSTSSWSASKSDRHRTTAAGDRARASARVLFTVIEGEGLGAQLLVLEGGERHGDGVPEEALAQADELIRGASQPAARALGRREGLRRGGTRRRRGCSSTARSTPPRRSAGPRSCSAGRRSSPTRAPSSRPASGSRARTS